MALSDGVKSGISKIIENIFDKIAYKFLGNIPGLRGKKIVISTKPNLGLANLFVQALDNRPPNAPETEILKSLLTSAHGYIDTLKVKTQENILQRLEEADTEESISEILDSEMNKASRHINMIVGSETSKTRNVSFTTDFTRVAASIGDTDPTCFFIVVKDNVTCKTCIKLHLHPDGTPKVFRYSELNKGYYVRGEEFPSILGAHPTCRCTVTYLGKDYGFNSQGRAVFIGHGHDEYKKQRS